MPSTVGAPQTLYDKILSAHIVDEKLDGTILLYIGRWKSGSGTLTTTAKCPPG
jgi:hypothetical protein